MLTMLAQSLTTIEQVHRLVKEIKNALENCSAAFLDVEQVFDRVWHTGLLYKAQELCHNFALVLI